MDEWTAETFIANREDPIPVITVQNSDISSDREGKHDPVEPNVTDGAPSGDADAESTSKHKRNHSLQDRLFTKLLQQVIPTEEYGVGGSTSDMGPASKYLQRPGFSLPLMTNNFRRFNARIGVVFVFQAQAIRLLTWRQNSHTLSFLAIYSFVCLYPYLLPALPCCLLLFFIFVPSYLARHPPPPSPSLSTPQYTLSGPPLAPARVIRPATEMSRDFFHNMRDLQNVMDDFATMHDLVLDAVTPLTNFSREALSSTLFMLLTFLTCGLFLAAPLLPWRQICLVGGWVLISLGHPQIQALAQSNYKAHLKPPSRRAGSWLKRWSAGDITLDADPELLEVEVFELQRRRWGIVRGKAATASNFTDDEDTGGETDGSISTVSAAEWEPWLFSSSAWEPLAPARIAGERPKGARFFEDVRAPEGWEWEDKKWVLDLGSQEWVEGRMLGGLEIEVEGERWVYDMSEMKRTKGHTKSGSKTSMGSVVESKEKALGDTRPEGRGEWRRRRWVRLVRRKRLRGDASGTRVLHTGPR